MSALERNKLVVEHFLRNAQNYEDIIIVARYNRDGDIAPGKFATFSEGNMVDKHLLSKITDLLNEMSM